MNHSCDGRDTVRCPPWTTQTTYAQKWPVIEGDSWPKSFSYDQQRVLANAANEDGGGWTWAITYPHDILGVALGIFMDLATALGLYASVCIRHLRGR